MNKGNILSDKDAMKFFADYIYNENGMFYDVEKDAYRIEERLKQLCSKYHQESFDDLLTYFSMKITSEMKTYVIDLFTNNETFFFRDMEVFKIFVESIVKPYILKKGLHTKYKLWINACSSGQEVYTVLMAIKEKFPEYPLENIFIHATDICEEALSKAKKGVYSNQDMNRGLPIQLVMKYFTQNEDDDTWSVKDILKNQVTWGRFNLTKDPYPLGKYHSVFCRNVLIYQKKENKKEIFENLFASIPEEGWLLLGAGESLLGMDLPYKNPLPNGTMFFHKKSS